MVKKTKLGEDIDMLLEIISRMRMEIEMQNELHTSTTSNVTHMVVYLESLISLLTKKEIFTKDEFNDETINFENQLSVKHSEMMQNAKKTATINYFDWLLTESKNIGNA